MLDTAASYLMVMQALQSPEETRRQSMMLLQNALAAGAWELSRDLLRFLKVRLRSQGRDFCFGRSSCLLRFQATQEPDDRRQHHSSTAVQLCLKDFCAMMDSLVVLASFAKELVRAAVAPELLQLLSNLKLRRLGTCAAQLGIDVFDWFASLRWVFG